MNRFTNGWLESIRSTLTHSSLHALLIILVTYSSAGLALTCKIDVPVRTDAFPLQGGNITVGNELPVGSIIYRQNITSTKDYAKAPHGKCDGSGPYTDRQYIYLTNMPQSLSSWQGGLSQERYTTRIFLALVWLSQGAIPALMPQPFSGTVIPELVFLMYRYGQLSR